MGKIGYPLAIEIARLLRDTQIITESDLGTVVELIREEDFEHYNKED